MENEISVVAGCLLGTSIVVAILETLWYNAKRFDYFVSSIRMNGFINAMEILEEHDKRDDFSYAPRRFKWTGIFAYSGVGLLLICILFGIELNEHQFLVGFAYPPGMLLSLGLFIHIAIVTHEIWRRLTG